MKDCHVSINQAVGISDQRAHEISEMYIGLCGNQPPKKASETINLILSLPLTDREKVWFSFHMGVIEYEMYSQKHIAFFIGTLGGFNEK